MVLYMMKVLVLLLELLSLLYDFVALDLHQIIVVKDV